MIVRTASPAETLWAAEQALRSGALGTVLLWLRHHVDYASLRRLHLAAEAGNCAAFVYRSTGFAEHPSPAPLRLRVDMEGNSPALTLIKRRGMMTSRRLRLNTSPAERRLPAIPRHASASGIPTASRPALSLVAH